MEKTNSMFPQDPFDDKRVFKFDKLPDGWRRISSRGMKVQPPKGWFWAHNDKDMFTRAFRIAIVRCKPKGE